MCKPNASQQEETDNTVTAIELHIQALIQQLEQEIQERDALLARIHQNEQQRQPTTEEQYRPRGLQEPVAITATAANTNSQAHQADNQPSLAAPVHGEQWTPSTTELAPTSRSTEHE